MAEVPSHERSNNALLTDAFSLLRRACGAATRTFGGTVGMRLGTGVRAVLREKQKE